MISKIHQSIERSGVNTIITKTFMRGLQTIESKVAKVGNKVYFKSWRIDEHNHTKKISQSYSGDKPIKNSRFVLDIWA